MALYVVTRLSILTSNGGWISSSMPPPDGRRLKFLNEIDEHSRLFLTVRVGSCASSRSWCRAGRAHQSLLGASDHPVGQRPGAQLLRRSPRATPGLSSIGMRHAPAPARPTSRQDPHGRTDSRYPSTTASYVCQER